MFLILGHQFKFKSGNVQLIVCAFIVPPVGREAVDHLGFWSLDSPRGEHQCHHLVTLL